MNPPSGRQLHLCHGDQELVVVEVGGGIRSYTRAGRPILDGYAEDEMCSSGRGQLLAPWPNRLGDGRFEWAGRTLQGPLSEPEKHNAIHGLVRWANWSLEAAGDSEAHVEYRLYPQPGWPWTLDFRVHYRLADDGLAVTTTVTNADHTAAPVGLGWHPYLAALSGRTIDGDQLTVPAATSYQADDRGLPTGRSAVEGTGLDFRGGRRVDELRLDTAFTDLDRSPDGRAWIELRAGSPAGDVTSMWVDAQYTHLMIYTGDTIGDPDRRRRAVAVEPMTCAPDALRSGDGLRILEPGQSLRATWGLRTA